MPRPPRFEDEHEEEDEDELGCGCQPALGGTELRIED
jgi:hypothetical protein